MLAGSAAEQSRPCSLAHHPLQRLQSRPSGPRGLRLASGPGTRVLRLTIPQASDPATSRPNTILITCARYVLRGMRAGFASINPG